MSLLAVNLAASGYHCLFIADPVPQNDWSVEDNGMAPGPMCFWIEDNGLAPGPMCFWIPVRTLSKLPATGATNMPGENSPNSILPASLNEDPDTSIVQGEIMEMMEI